MANYKIHDNVKLGHGTEIQDYCIIGLKNYSSDDKTTIGEHALIRSHTTIYAGNQIGSNLSTGHMAMIRENNKIGDNVSVGSQTVIEHSCMVGNNVRIHSQCFIPEFTTIGDNVWIGPRVCLTNAKFPNSPNAKKNLKGVVIEEGAIICANATILPGIRIGKNAFVGAGAVVTKNVDEGCVVYGNPAKEHCSVSELSEENGQPAYMGAK